MTRYRPRKPWRTAPADGIRRFSFEGDELRVPAVSSRQTGVVIAGKKARRYWLRRDVTEGVSLPRGYGIAYVDICRRITACYPVPLNLVVALLREAWGLIRMPLSSRTQRAYMDGFVAGKKDERQRGSR